MALVRWRPLNELARIEEEMDRMFDRFFGSSLLEDVDTTPTVWSPDVDIAETKDAFVVTVELPGLNKKDIHVRYKDGMLTIEGERKREKEEKDVNYYRVERQYGKFCRSFHLPAEVKEDKIEASYKDGVLTVRLPKSEEAKSREIEVKVA